MMKAKTANWRGPDGFNERVTILEIKGDLARILTKLGDESWTQLGRLSISGQAKERKALEQAAPRLF